MGKKLRKCKTCGRPFAPKSADDRFCSPTCRATGCFVAGGGDQTKPMTPEMKKAAEKKRKAEGIRTEEKPAKVRNGAERFPRVHLMYSLPIGERWAIAKTFTKEEAEYSARLARKMLMEERRMDDLIDWDYSRGDAEPLGSYEGIAGGSLGDSDDGTI